MIRSTTAAAAVVAAVLFAGVAHAQSFRNARLTSCTDAAGQRVYSLSTTRLHNVGMAGRYHGRPVMLFNPVILARFRPATRTFWFYHECAHHALGHSLGNRPMSRERDADCWAIRQMKRRGLLTAAKLRTIERDLYPLRGDGVLYLDGPQRAAYVGTCATGRRTAPQMVRRGVRRNHRPGTGYRPSYRRRYADRRDDYYPPEGPVAAAPRYRDRYGPSGSGVR